MSKKTGRTAAKKPLEYWLKPEKICCGEPYQVRRFNSSVTFKAHFIIHVLGFRYDDASWNREHWAGSFETLSKLDNEERSEIVNNLIKWAGCEAAKRRCKAQEAGSKINFDHICSDCRATNPNYDQCSEILRPWLQKWELIIQEALNNAHTCPRYIQYIRNKGQKGLHCMRHLDDNGVLLISRDDKRSQTFKELYICTCYPPQPLINGAAGPGGFIDLAGRRYERECLAGKIRQTVKICTEHTWKIAECEGSEKPSCPSVSSTRRTESGTQHIRATDRGKRLIKSSGPSVPSTKGKGPSAHKRAHSGFTIGEMLGEQVVKELREKIEAGKRKRSG